MARTEGQNSIVPTGGIVLHAARFHDFLAWTMILGREVTFREKVIELGRLRPGESVLDVGCGTGTLAIAAKRRVGSTGRVCGIDASPEMIARASRKARRAGLDIEFKNEVIEALTFPDAQFDAVLSTLMLHHLPRTLREDGAREICRVLKPCGRVLVVDFEGNGAAAMFSRALSSAPWPSKTCRGDSIAQFCRTERDGWWCRGYQGPPLYLSDRAVLQIMKCPRHLWLALAIAAVIIAGHGVVLYYVSSHMAASMAVFGGVFVLVLLKHLRLLAAFFAPLRKWRTRP